jgi:ribonuclease-3
MSGDLAALEGRLAYAFRDRALLEQALRHPSWAPAHPGEDHNQRLEFLGDAVVQLVLTEALCARYPADREGVLSKRRALLISGAFLAALARELELGPCLRLGADAAAAGGAGRDAALGDALEAVVGAVHLDSAGAASRAVVLGIFGDLAARLAGREGAANPKGRLQELAQPVHGNQAVRYELVGTRGADHAKEYEVAVYLLDRRLGTGRGSSKKLAEEEAARAALAALAAPGRP